jgi:hypothetical protein
MVAKTSLGAGSTGGYRVNLSYGELSTAYNTHGVGRSAWVGRLRSAVARLGYVGPRVGLGADAAHGGYGGGKTMSTAFSAGSNGLLDTVYLLGRRPHQQLRYSRRHVNA